MYAYPDSIQQEFLDDNFMDDFATAGSWEHLRRPRLRQCKVEEPFIFTKKLGSGVDGIV